MRIAFIEAVMQQELGERFPFQLTQPVGEFRPILVRNNLDIHEPAEPRQTCQL